MHNVLIVEDEIELAGYLKAGLSAAGYAPTHLSDGSAGLNAALTGQWDLIIIDRMLPNEFEGLSIVTAMRKAGLTTPVLALSALASLGEKVRGLRDGCDDYLTKPFAMPELLARVDALIRRATASEESQLMKLADLTLDLRTREAKRSGQSIVLQPREFRLLSYFFKNQDKIVTRTMLLRAVWDINFDPGTNVIDVQISRLRNKLDRGFSPPLLHTVRGAGYRFGINE
jgi:two-component system OmpR family response regulator